MLDTTYRLRADAVDRFEQDGFVKLKGMLDGRTIATYEAAITTTVTERNTMHLPMNDRNTYQRAFLQVENLWEHDTTVRDLVFSRRLAQVAARLLQVKAVRLFHDQALYKEPGGGITPWHADQYYWPFASDRSCTVWIPLQPTPAEMGPLSFSVGSHRFEYGRDLSISDESEAAMQAALADQDFPLESSAYDLGEVSYHLGWTFHRAGPNFTRSARKVMTIIYMDADMIVAPPHNPAQQGDLDIALCGATPGTVAAGPRNPVLATAE